jgi:hypothetical protein
MVAVKRMDPTQKVVSIPSDTVEIEGKAFKGWTWLEKIAIPSSVRRIGELAFDGCASLKSVEFVGGIVIGGDWRICIQSLLVGEGDSDSSRGEEDR